jgi:hypothetical protein
MWGKFKMPEREFFEKSLKLKNADRKLQIYKSLTGHSTHLESLVSMGCEHVRCEKTKPKKPIEQYVKEIANKGVD